MKVVAITVSGKVQGVFFRKYTQMKANELNVSGSVRNMPNGDVYLEVQGTKDQIDEMIQWCHKGSPLSIVKKVEVKKVTLTEIIPQRFVIIY